MPLSIIHWDWICSASENLSIRRSKSTCFSPSSTGTRYVLPVRICQSEGRGLHASLHHPLGLDMFRQWESFYQKVEVYMPLSIIHWDWICSASENLSIRRSRSTCLSPSSTGTGYVPPVRICLSKNRGLHTFLILPPVKLNRSNKSRLHIQVNNVQFSPKSPAVSIHLIHLKSIPKSTSVVSQLQLNSIVAMRSRRG